MAYGRAPRQGQSQPEEKQSGEAVWAANPALDCVEEEAEHEPASPAPSDTELCQRLVKDSATHGNTREKIFFLEAEFSKTDQTTNNKYF